MTTTAAAGALSPGAAPSSSRNTAQTAKPVSTTLTDGEMQVLRGMSQGKSNGQIGRELFVSEDTVKTHARRLFRKLGAVDRAHAVMLGCAAGLLDAEMNRVNPRPVATSRGAASPLSTAASPAEPSVTLTPCPRDARRLASVMFPGAQGAGAQAGYDRSLHGLQQLAGTASV